MPHSEFHPILFRIGSNRKILAFPRPKSVGIIKSAFMVNLQPKKAHLMFFTTGSDILREYQLLAGLDKIQQPYNDKWSCFIPPKENRLKVRIEAGEKNFEHSEH